jgi:hypothetical protein
MPPAGPQNAESAPCGRCRSWLYINGPAQGHSTARAGTLRSVLAPPHRGRQREGASVNVLVVAGKVTGVCSPVARSEHRRVVSAADGPALGRGDDIRRAVTLALPWLLCLHHAGQHSSRCVIGFALEPGRASPPFWCGWRTRYRAAFITPDRCDLLTAGSGADNAHWFVKTQWQASFGVAAVTKPTRPPGCSISEAGCSSKIFLKPDAPQRF